MKEVHEVSYEVLSKMAHGHPRLLEAMRKIKPAIIQSSDLAAKQVKIVQDQANKASTATDTPKTEAAKAPENQCATEEEIL